jgi:CBS domain-containing protein
MAQVQELLKDRKLYTIDAGSTVLEAARLMMEHSLGAVPVLRDGELAGVFSERDVMNRVVAAGRTPGTTPVTEVMTANPRSVAPEETIENCMFLMREYGFRHLLVCEGTKVKGVVSMRDIMLRYLAQMAAKV